MANAGKVVLGLGAGVLGVWGLSKIFGGPRGPVSVRTVMLGLIDRTTGAVLESNTVPAGLYNFRMSVRLRNNSLPVGAAVVARVLQRSMANDLLEFAAGADQGGVAPDIGEEFVLTGGASSLGELVPGTYDRVLQVLQTPQNEVILEQRLPDLIVK